ncbi:MAG: hypothetical protein ACI8Y4_002992 [Candidatus Poriferisodalaceae bacterium]|jgi:hypothetical protein
MTSKRSGRGLGKALSGILGDAAAAERAPEVSGLLGAAQLRRGPEVRSLITGMALDSLVDGFGAETALIAARDDAGGLAAVGARLPANWNTLSEVAFETVGRLWAVLGESNQAVSGQADSGQAVLDARASDDFEQVEMDGAFLLVCRCATASRPIAAAMLRGTRFSSQEERTIARLIRSVALALYSDVALPSDAAIRVLTRAADDGVLADVRVGDSNDRRNAAAVADDAVTAVARASAELCDAALSVKFVGQTRVHSSLVTVVVLDDADGGPLFGLAVTDPASTTGPVEAVFSAAAVASYDPFVVPQDH